MDAEATFATADPLPSDEQIVSRILPAIETMACAVHQGAPNTIGPACLALLSWVEALGYTTLVMPDTIEYSLAPLVALGAAAAATRSLRLGTYVIANNYRHPVLLAKEAVGEKIGWLRAAAGKRFAGVELNINLVGVGGQLARYVAAQFGTEAATLADSNAVTVLAGGSEEMCERLVARRDRLGISYITVPQELMEAFSPIVARLSGR